jgi:hypothetical protein
LAGFVLNPLMGGWPPKGLEPNTEVPVSDEPNGLAVEVELPKTLPVIEENAPNGEGLAAVELELGLRLPPKVLNGLAELDEPKGDAVDLDSAAKPDDANAFDVAGFSGDFIVLVANGEAVEKFENAAGRGC